MIMSNAEKARDLADRISALEKNARAARMDGDVTLYQELLDEMNKLSDEAKNFGFSSQEYPGLFRHLGSIFRKR